jgi:hypothetical protein
MAVTPREAAKINDKNERKAVVEMESHIDGVLSAQYRTGTKVTLSAGEIRKAGGVGYSDRALDEVLSNFCSVGWSVKKKSHKERYGANSYSYQFSEAASSMVQLQAESFQNRNSQFDADNEMLPPEKQR